MCGQAERRRRFEGIRCLDNQGRFTLKKETGSFPENSAPLYKKAAGSYRKREQSLYSMSSES